MSLPVTLFVAIAIFVLAVVAVGVWAHCSRARPETPVTEAEARAHASPLTRSVLSVSPRGLARADEAAATVSDIHVPSTSRSIIAF
jgi:hypothetical protein